MFEKFDGRDDEFAKLLRRINPPMVVIDNDSCEDATVIQVDSVNKHGILLQVVQVLTDLNLVIKKAYISSDGGWFMDVFNVINRDGEKVRDQEVINYIQKRLKSDEDLVSPLNGMVGLMPSKEHTCIELTGTDRPGLLSEEYYIRHMDGVPISSKAERERVMQCLEAAIERRASEGLELELCAEDRVRLLSDITGIFGKRVCASKEPKSRQRAGKQGTLFTSRM